MNIYQRKLLYGVMLILVLFSVACTVTKKPQASALQAILDTPSYTLYPYLILRDTFIVGSYLVMVPIRSCKSTSEKQYVAFVDLIGLKFNEFKHLTLQQFNDSVVKTIFEGKCLESLQNLSYSTEISITEYNSLNADTLMAKYFKSGYYGDINEDNTVPIPREIWKAFLVLFDKKYVITRSDALNLFTIRKAPSDDQVRQYLKENNH